MDIADLLSSERVLLDVDATCAKQAFKIAAQNLSQNSTLDERQIIDALCERERLGSTGVGDGVSIPHARFEGLKEIVGMFLRLQAPIDMDAIDDKHVKMMFVLLAPEDANAEHLKLLARIARVLRSPDNQETLKTTTSSQEVLTTLTSEDA